MSASHQSTTRPLRLSVLDQTPVPDGSSPAHALANSLDLARHVDHLGYTRLWYSEHHAMDLLACTAPEILIARAAAETGRIRVGSGGIMLPHYSSFKIAEVFRTLHAMFPNRIDLGIGRAPGGGQLEAYALRRNRKAPVPDDFPQQLAELRAFLHPERFPSEHAFGTVRVSPAPDPIDAPGSPDIWLLGSSMWSAVTAAQQGLPYAFAHFFSPIQTREAIEYYQQNFQPQQNSASPTSVAPSMTGSSSWVGSQAVPGSQDGRTTPEATLAIGVICAETQQEADTLHASVRLLQRRIRMDDRRPVATPEDALRELKARPIAPNPLFPFTAGSLDQPESEFPRYIVGTPGNVRAELLHIATELNLDELIINTITHSHEARKRSYTLLAEAMSLETLRSEAIAV